ncbi:MAG TPA: peptide-methionine (S)-S-oxide reductase MsrA [Acidobacteriota bacterium]|nr:peptide-methionine (S)-S-oxide reductase MsrA [Acidobacteriota bacterium]
MTFLKLFVVVLFMTSAAFADTSKATFAGGCFWCMEEPFDKLDGVISTTSGFTGGGSQDTTYGEVSSGKTAHLESVEILYDPGKISYEELLEVFWKNIDPTNPEGQFCDRGAQYRSAIFYHDETQKQLAEQSKQRIESILKKPIVTPILKATEFHLAEDYHQDFYKKNALRYKQYKIRCGRERRLHELWGE